MTKRLLVILLLTAVAVALAGVWLRTRNAGSGVRFWWRESRAPQSPAASDLPSDTEMVSYLCYFPSRSGFNLTEEIRERPKPSTALDKLRAVVTELHRGPATAAALPLFPNGLAPRAIFLTSDGTAYLDERAEVFDRPLGPREEFLFMRALARTLLRNCPEVKAFVLLENGSVRHKLFAHLPAHGRYILPRRRLQGESASPALKP